MPRTVSSPIDNVLIEFEDVVIRKSARKHTPKPKRETKNEKRKEKHTKVDHTCSDESD